MSVINRQALLDEIEITSFEDYGDYITVRDLIAQFPSADRKTEPQKKMCANCKHIKKHNGKLADYVCDRKGSIVTNPYDKECDEMWERKDEPQTETEIAKAIVHKMIDDAVIAEDAYPNLRQKMHDAVDEYEPQTEREGE